MIKALVLLMIAIPPIATISYLIGYSDKRDKSYHQGYTHGYDVGRTTTAKLNQMDTLDYLHQCYLLELSIGNRL